MGHGDGGGGTTREMVGRAERLANLEGSATVRWEHPDEFFARAKTELPDPPVWVGELYLEIHRATLTSQHKTKQGNRRSEQLLVEAELWATTAALRTGADYPYAELDELWQSLLLHQFHDILPGTSIAWVHREAQAAYAEIQERAEAIITGSLAALTGEGGIPLRVNACPFRRDGATALAVTPEHELVPSSPVSLTEDPAGFLLENELVIVQLSREGHVVSAVDRATGRDAVASGQEAGVLQLHQDFPNKWDAWDVDRFYRNTVTDLHGVNSIRAESDEDGTAAVTVTREFSESQVTQRISLAPGSRTLRYEQTTDWDEAEKFLKVAFPLDVRAEHTAAETQFGHYRRVTHTNTSWDAARFETSMHRFVLAEEPGFGVALVNDSIYAFDVTRNADDDAEVTTTLRLSLLRAPRFPDPETDLGRQSHTYGLVIGADTATATAEGVAMNTPERRVQGSRAVEPLVTAEGKGLMVSSVKLADDRSGDVVVRVYESLGRRASGTVRLHAGATSVRTVSLLEDDLSEAEGSETGAPEAAAGTSAMEVSLRLKPFEVRTLRFTRA